MSQERFNLDNYRLESAQTWGSVWLVPIVRNSPSSGDLRLQELRSEQYVVDSSHKGARFLSYMPSGYVLDWKADGTAVATDQLHFQNKDNVTYGKLWRRHGKTKLGFLPQSLAIEGFLVQHFGGPKVGWLDYERDVRRGNLGFRCESAVPGWFLKGVTEALRVFEFAPEQVGSALFIDGKLVNCFITPHPDDYAQLHSSLLTDQYPAYLVHYGYLREAKTDFPMQTEKVTDLLSLRKEFERARQEKLTEESLRLDSILNREIESKTLYKAGPFSIRRFIAKIESNADNYCGELIQREDGQIEYLKLYHLSNAESRRLLILRALSNNDWVFERSAQELGTDSAEGVARMMIGADLGYLLNRGIWAHLLKKNFV